MIPVTEKWYQPNDTAALQARTRTPTQKMYFSKLGYNPTAKTTHYATNGKLNVGEKHIHKNNNLRKRPK